MWALLCCLQCGFLRREGAEEEREAEEEEEEEGGILALVSISVPLPL